MDLFPTRVWSVSLAALNPHVPQWIEHIEDWRRQTPQPEGRSNRMGWNSAQSLLQQPVFQPLAQAVQAVMDHIFAEMGPPQPRYLLNGWANVHDQGGYNTFHNHAGALLSACYYLKVPAGSGPIVFRDPRPGALLSPWQGSLRPNAGSEIAFQPEAGQLLLFPHWLEHGVEAHAAADSRISIAINAIPDYTGSPR
ncbi:TIGR02466 family protein [Vogesella sp. LIG4]|uniref:TIGR02466 family protein n=1 Tax=Vogesella sp. LIG4 TaxID=1192162 RepID=UPI0012FDE1BA|nr:TIGR02466 family protein [Vogesella sp. LIG4]